MKAIDTETKTILRGIIEKRHEAMKNGEPTRDDLLGLLLESNMNYTDSDGKSSRGITLEEVIEECKLFYFAGTETTAVLLTWTIVVLSMHPEWQDQARDEVLEVFGQNNPDLSGVSRLKVVSVLARLIEKETFHCADDSVSFRDLHANILSYLIIFLIFCCLIDLVLLQQVTMVLYEVLRLYPPALFINRRTHKQTELGGVTYPPDVMVVVPIMFIHRDPALWGHDAGEFNPRRFAEGVSKACSDPGAFIPFSWGPRICIGQNFALLEAKLAICMILQRFAFELSPAYVHAPYNVLTLHPQHGVLVRLRRL
jgi:cytochrome P450